MVHYEPVKVTIDAPSLAEVILDVIFHHRGLPDTILSNRGSLFTSKFLIIALLCYLLAISEDSSAPSILRPTASPKDRIARWKLILEFSSNFFQAFVKLRAFAYFEQNEWARLLSLLTATPRVPAPVTRF